MRPSRRENRNAAGLAGGHGNAAGLPRGHGNAAGLTRGHGNAAGLTRRRFLAASGGAAAFGALGGPALLARTAAAATPTAAQSAALRVLGRSALRVPGSLPDPALPAGTDTLPGLDHIVVLMLENHSYDNLFGMLGRGPGQTPRGDGFTIGANGLPTATNPYPDGRIQHAFHMPTTCQLSGRPSQDWVASHTQYANGGNDGFVISASGPVAMGYWTGDDLPFTYALAETFPIGDRWFSSLLGQTDPNRRYLIAGTSAGMTNDIGTSPGNFIPDAGLPLPANGTIVNTLDLHGISWANYADSYPTGATPELYPTDDAVTEQAHYKPFSQFYADTAAGDLPSFSLLDPNYGTQSQENPQNIAVGERLLADVVNALGGSPLWRSTLFVLVYDEHGGYFDHVPPPPALAPDAIPPMVEPGEPAYDGFSHYGFRVPSVVVSPYAKPGFVSHVYYDHTSILAMIERKWNLPALTYRDANANDLTDFIDLGALSKGHPAFRSLPRLPAPGDTPAALACSTTGPGTIPPPDSVTG